MRQDKRGVQVICFCSNKAQKKRTSRDGKSVVGSWWKSAKHVVHRIDEFLHGGFGFVAHVGDAEGGAFDFAVTAVDQEVVLGLEVLDEAGEVETFRSLEASERLRAAAFRGEEFEAVLGTPGGD